MTMFDLTEKRVKITAHTITVKDEADKTRGMVRNINTIANAPMRVIQPLFKDLKSSGVWSDEKLSNNVIISDGKPYLLRNLKYEQDYHRYFEGRGFDADDAHYRRIMEIYSTAPDHNITIIPCYIVR